MNFSWTFPGFAILQNLHDYWIEQLPLATHYGGTDLFSMLQH